MLWGRDRSLQGSCYLGIVDELKPVLSRGQREGTSPYGLVATLSPSIPCPSCSVTTQKSSLALIHFVGSHRIAANPASLWKLRIRRTDPWVSSRIRVKTGAAAPWQGLVSLSSSGLVWDKL